MKIASDIKKSDLQKIEKVKKLYKVYYEPNTTKYEFWKKNPKGFYNIIGYLENDSEEQFNHAILNDLKNTKKSKKDIYE